MTKNTESFCALVRTVDFRFFEQDAHERIDATSKLLRPLIDKNGIVIAGGVHEKLAKTAFYLTEALDDKGIEATYDDNDELRRVIEKYRLNTDPYATGVSDILEVARQEKIWTPDSAHSFVVVTSEPLIARAQELQREEMRLVPDEVEPGGVLVLNDKLLRRYEDE